MTAPLPARRLLRTAAPEPRVSKRQPVHDRSAWERANATKREDTLPLCRGDGQQVPHAASGRLMRRLRADRQRRRAKSPNGALGEIRTILPIYSFVVGFSLQFDPRDKSRGRQEGLWIYSVRGAGFKGNRSNRGSNTFVISRLPSPAPIVCLWFRDLIWRHLLLVSRISTPRCFRRCG